MLSWYRGAMLELAARVQNQPISPAASVVRNFLLLPEVAPGSRMTPAVNMPKLVFDITDSIWVRSLNFIVNLVFKHSILSSPARLVYDIQ